MGKNASDLPNWSRVVSKVATSPRIIDLYYPYLHTPNLILPIPCMEAPPAPCFATAISTGTVRDHIVVEIENAVIVEKGAVDQILNRKR